MPVFDWTRSDLAKVRPDGATVLSYDQDIIDKIDPEKMFDKIDSNSNGYVLPGWEPERLSKIKELFEKCHISTDKTQDVISGYSQLDAEYEYISVKWFNENYYIPFAEDILLEGNNKCLKITEYERGEKWQNL